VLELFAAGVQRFANPLPNSVAHPAPE
jgi:hypothetical protein